MSRGEAPTGRPVSPHELVTIAQDVSDWLNSGRIAGENAVTFDANEGDACAFFLLDVGERKLVVKIQAVDA